MEIELAQIRSDFERLKSQDNTKSERLEELSWVFTANVFVEIVQEIVFTA